VWLGGSASSGIAEPPVEFGKVSDHQLELKLLSALVASEKRVESISLHRCGACVVMQTHVSSVQLDYDISPPAAELLKLLFRFDV
jgi:hypothetical protein